MPNSIFNPLGNNWREILPAIILLLVSLPASAQVTIDYSDVAPIFNSHCVVCHNGPAAPKGLQLNSYQGIRKGSQSGAVAIPGQSANSELVRRIRGQSQPRMPLTGPPFLSDADTDRIAQWIDSGMAEGQSAPSKAVATRAYQPGDEVIYRDVAPIFAQRCIKCHRDNDPRVRPPEGLSLLTHDSMIRGGDRVVIIPGSVNASELLRRIKGIASPRMPFDGPPWLSEDEIYLISEWIRQGAKDNNGEVARPPVGQQVRLHGRLTDRWALDGVPLLVDGRTRIKKSPRIGSYVRIRGYVGQDGRIHATRISSR